jgi:hypothetical protein
MPSPSKLADQDQVVGRCNRSQQHRMNVLKKLDISLIDFIILAAGSHITVAICWVSQKATILQIQDNEKVH